eukprot:GFUD01005222.1.p1 GENE.GFUD01005222.1~~GFUD01005222.1.p1  ORF type:complete len:201 (-),score=75.77 GFUD01005222.1:54-656(-)
MVYKVHVLQPGYSRVESDGCTANGSSTLIIGSKCKVVVDTLSPWDKDTMLAALARHGVTPREVTHMVCTHGHPDHVGNNNLFTGEGVVHIVGWSVYSKDKYIDHPFHEGEVFRIDGEDLVVMPTPGHTLDSVSVRVNTEEGVVVVAGDLFEKQEDLADESIWKEAGSEDEEAQQENRRKILEMADLIVPGHGPMFRVVKD